MGTNCEDRALDRTFRESGLMDYILEYIRENQETIMLSIPHGLWWCASYETEDSFFLAAKAPENHPPDPDHAVNSKKEAGNTQSGFL